MFRSRFCSLWAVFAFCLPFLASIAQAEPAKPVAVAPGADAAKTEAAAPVAEKIGSGELPSDAIIEINDRNYAPAVMRLIQGSRKSIRLSLYQAQHYEEYPNSTSNQLIDSVIAAKRRGVDVEVLFDTSPFPRDRDRVGQNKRVAMRFHREGIRAHLAPPETQNHQKVIVVDGQTAVVGSVNWTHYALNVNREVAVMIWGADVAKWYEKYIAEQIAKATPFEPDSPDMDGGPKELELPKDSAEAVEEGPATPEVIARVVRKPIVRGATVQSANNQEFYPVVSDAISKAKQRIDLFQGYALFYSKTPNRPGAKFVAPRKHNEPSATNELLDDMVDARQRGVYVRAIFDLSYRDGEFAYRSEAFANRMQALGCDVFMDDPLVQIHAKGLLIDDYISVIGSTNWSYDAIELNGEASVVIRSKDFWKIKKAWVDSLFLRGRSILEGLPEPPPEEKKEEKSEEKKSDSSTE